jgi:hypothetical protein
MENREATFREALLAALGLAALAVLFCGPHWLWNPDLAPFDNGDSVGSYFPYFARAQQPVSPHIAGEWDPTLWTGMPESYSPFGRYYPPTRLLLALFPLGLAFSLNYVLHHALAGLGTYLLIRTCGFGRASAWLAAMVFGFSGFMLFHRPLLTIQQTAAWLPWILWAFENFRRQRTWLWVAIAATLLALHALVGHTQTVIISGLVWVPYAIYFMIAERGSLSQRLRFGLGVGVACVLGAVGALPQLLPMVEVGGWTPYTAADFNFYKSGSFELRYTAGLAGPWVLGGAFDVPAAGGQIGADSACAFGLLPLALIIIGLCAAVTCFRRGGAPESAGALAAPPPVSRADAGFWLLLYALHVLFMLGRQSPLYVAFFKVPIYNMFHVPARHFCVMSLAAAWFAALGLERLRAAAVAARFTLWRQVAAGFVLLAVSCTVIVATYRDWPAKPGLGYPGFWIPLLVGVAVLGLLGATLRSTRRRPLWIGAILVLAFIELRLTLGDYFLSPMSTSRVLAPEHFPDVVRLLRASQDGDVPARCLIENGAWRSEVPKGDAPNAWGQMWGVSVLNCYSQSMPRSLSELLDLDKYGVTHFNRVLFEERGLSAVGGRFIVPKRPPRPAAPGVGFVDLDRHDLWPDSAPVFCSQPDRPSRLDTRTLLYAKHPYLLEGELIRKGGRHGAFHIKLTDFGKVVGNFSIDADQLADGRCEFAHFLEPLLERDLRSGVEIHLECTGDLVVELSTFTLWSLTARPPDTSVASARNVLRSLRQGILTPYVARASMEAHVYENPRARSLATLCP